MGRIVYKLNGYNLNELGIIVKSADGLIDLPDLKERQSYDWEDMHGKIIDTRRPYFKERTITLNCAWPLELGGAYNMQTAQQKIREDLLGMGELVRLQVEFDSIDKPLIFNVLQDKNVQFGRKYSGSAILLTFTLTLIEPQPCKMVLVSEGAKRPTTEGAPNTGQTKISFSPLGATFDIDWGDGNTSYDVTGTGIHRNYHTYTDDADHYIIISGDIATALFTDQAFSSDITLLWTLK